MYFDLRILKEKSDTLQKIIDQAQKRLRSSPEGTLGITAKRNGIVHYYKRESSTKGEKVKRIYLKNDELEIAKALAQKTYDKQLLAIALKQKQAIDAFLRDYDANALKALFSATSPERRALIQAAEIDDEEFVRQWEAVTFPPGDFEEGSPEFYTLKGERVRSKAEIIIGDTLNAHAVPYRYEPPLIIVPGKKPWRPDFVVLNKRTRQEFILEHLGKMDDEQYCNDNLGKIKKYMEHGIFPGEKLILTAETSTRQLSTRDLERIIRHFFL